MICVKKIHSAEQKDNEIILLMQLRENANKIRFLGNSLCNRI